MAFKILKFVDFIHLKILLNSIVPRINKYKQMKGKGKNKNHKKHTNRPENKGIQAEPTKPCGLPNSGNKCFLNSVIQQIYRIGSIRDKVIQLKDSKQTNILIDLGKLFYEMESRKTITKEIKKYLRSIAKFLQKSLIDYKQGNQYDSFQTFLNILNEVFEGYTQLYKLFEVQYSIECGCSEEKTFLSDLTIDNCPNICCNCGTYIERKLFTHPQYLIVRNGGKQKEDLIQQFRKQNFEYQFQSSNIYIGDGENGHYYSICRQSHNEIYKMNDSQVEKICSDKLQNYIEQNSLFSIYQKKQKNLQIESKKDHPINSDKKVQQKLNNKKKVKPKYQQKKEKPKQQYIFQKKQSSNSQFQKINAQVEQSNKLNKNQKNFSLQHNNLIVNKDFPIFSQLKRIFYPFIFVYVPNRFYRLKSMMMDIGFSLWQDTSSFKRKKYRGQTSSGV